MMKVNTLLFTQIGKALRQIASKSMALIKSPQGQQASITGDLTPEPLEWRGVGRRKTTAVVYNKMSTLGAPKEDAGFCENPVFINLFLSTFSFLSSNIVNKGIIRASS
jgi:hypothetical protein